MHFLWFSLNSLWIGVVQVMMKTTKEQEISFTYEHFDTIIAWCIELVGWRKTIYGYQKEKRRPKMWRKEQAKVHKCVCGCRMVDSFNYATRTYKCQTFFCFAPYVCDAARSKRSHFVVSILYSLETVYLNLCRYVEWLCSFFVAHLIVYIFIAVLISIF